MNRICVFLWALGMCACSTLSLPPLTEELSESPKTTVDPSFQTLVKPSSQDELELRIARLSSRMDALDIELIRQKERGKLLEKGLLLGLVPQELRSSGKADEIRPAQGSGQLSLSAVKLLEVKTPDLPEKIESQDRESYRKKIQDAQEKFNRGNYGQAIAAYADIGNEFDDSVTEGSQHYWTGLGWYYLKEYKSAEENFQTLRSRYPGSPWNEHAAFYLAKVEFGRGYHQKALAQYQKILEANPSRDLREMAQAEIERMKEKL